jgi:uncharacterized protein
MRTMSQRNVEIVKTLFAAWKARDPQAALEHIDSDFDVDFTGVSSVPAGVARGAEGLQHVVAEWIDVFGSIDYFPQNFIDAGDHVIVWLRFTARGRGSGAPLESKIAVVYTLKDGLVVGFRGY